MRTERILNSDLEIDNEERDWWNHNADMIEKIWAQNIEMQNVIRKPYLKKMKKFFLKGSKKTPVRILEVGCGSGWVCRLVADENFHIVGTDFSESQLRIAKEMAVKFQKSNYCTYEMADASEFKKDIDGIVIHALLHHLSAKELEVFFKNFSNLLPGTKVFIYEPAFLERADKVTFYDRVINKLIRIVKTKALNIIKQKGQVDTDLENALAKVYSDADSNGWYISPKEVPFYENELESYLLPHCSLSKKYIVNKTDLDISQAMTLNSIETPPFIISKVYIPIARFLDRLSFKGNFTHYIPANQHLFVCTEWVKK